MSLPDDRSARKFLIPLTMAEAEQRRNHIELSRQEIQIQLDDPRKRDTMSYNDYTKWRNKAIYSRTLYEQEYGFLGRWMDQESHRIAELRREAKKQEKERYGPREEAALAAIRAEALDLGDPDTLLEIMYRTFTRMVRKNGLTLAEDDLGTVLVVQQYLEDTGVFERNDPHNKEKDNG